MSLAVVREAARPVKNRQKVLRAVLMIYYKLIGLAIAGALGALARYGLAGLFPTSPGGGFPLGTLIVNVVGCFVFCLLWRRWLRAALSRGRRFR